MSCWQPAAPPAPRARRPAVCRAPRLFAAPCPAAVPLLPCRLPRRKAPRRAHSARVRRPAPACRPEARLPPQARPLRRLRPVCRAAANRLAPRRVRPSRALAPPTGAPPSLRARPLPRCLPRPRRRPPRPERPTETVGFRALLWQSAPWEGGLKSLGAVAGRPRLPLARNSDKLMGWGFRAYTTIKPPISDGFFIHRKMSGGCSWKRQ